VGASLTYVNRSGVLWRAASAYVWVHAATTANYTPVAAYRYNTTGGTNTVPNGLRSRDGHHVRRRLPALT
jgi:hypothetical protein